MPDRMRSTVSNVASNSSPVPSVADVSSVTTPMQYSGYAVRDFTGSSLRTQTFSPASYRHKSQPGSAALHTKTLDADDDECNPSPTARSEEVAKAPGEAASFVPCSDDLLALRISPEAPLELLHQDRVSAWQGISEVAPNATIPAQLIEMQHELLRDDLRAVGGAVRASRYGLIAGREPSSEQRVQQRTAHATYSYLMRQRRAREAELSRRGAWEIRFG